MISNEFESFNKMCKPPSLPKYLNNPLELGKMSLNKRDSLFNKQRTCDIKMDYETK